MHAPLALVGGLLLGGPALLALPLAAQQPHAAPSAQTAPEPQGERRWIECTGEARPPEEARLPSQRPVPRAVDSFDLSVIAGVLGGEDAVAPAEGCALFLMWWNGQRELESHALLETSLPEADVRRIEDALLAGRVERGPRDTFIRVLVRTAPELDVVTGFAWEDPPALVNRDEAQDYLNAVFLEGVSRRNAVLQVLVIADGPGLSPTLTFSSGHPRVDQQILFLVPFFRFRAGRVEGIVYDRWLSIPLHLTAQPA